MLLLLLPPPHLFLRLRLWVLRRRWNLAVDADTWHGYCR
jgi:hypothetical protein